MQVKAVPINSYMITGPNGKTSLMQAVGPEWNGMTELQDKDGLRLIVVRGSPILEAFDKITGVGTSFDVVSGTPALLLELGLHP